MDHGNAVKHRNVVLEPGRRGEHAAGFEQLGGEVRGTSGWPSAAVLAGLANLAIVATGWAREAAECRDEAAGRHGADPEVREG